MKKITCLGSGSGKSGDPYYDAMVNVGHLLAQKQIIVLTGGFGGIGMQAPAQGAVESGGKAIGYTIFGKPGNAYLSEEVDCRKFFINSLSGAVSKDLTKEEQFCIRLSHLITADGFIIAAGGGPGTMVELTTLINFNHKVWKNQAKKIAILKLDNEGIGWDENMLRNFEDWGFLPREVRDLIFIASSPEEAVSWVTT